MNQTDDASRHDTRSSATRLRPAAFWLGTLGLLVSLAAAVILSGEHLDVLSAPGCGDDSPCARATASAWGRVPGLGWPLSFVGLSYFAAMAAAWTVGLKRGSIGRPVRLVARLGGLVSIMLIAAMFAGGYLCPYCVLVHLGNFALLIGVELMPRAASAGRAQLLWAAAAFAVTTGIEAGVLAGAQGRLQQQLDESTRQVIAGGGRVSGASTGGGFTGRYRIGPEEALIRLVVFSDYQCPECRMFEGQVREVLAQRDDISFSAKQFPMSSACNPQVTSNRHPNACWAARAAETAGLLRGAEGFYEMHHWLFDRGGGFTSEELVPHLREAGYDVDEFLRIMQGPETLELVQADIDEGVELGLHFTPMVFVNGVELKAWRLPGALQQMIAGIVAAGVEPATTEADEPVSAERKYVEDWLQGRQRGLGASRWVLGPDDAPVEIVIWGDYQEPHTAAIDRCVRDLVEDRGTIEYGFRHYPFNRACNSHVQADRHPQACLAHRAAEAAGSIGGNDTYWAMHAWLMDHQEGLDEPALRAAASELGLNPDALIAAMSSPAIEAGIAADTQWGPRLGMRSIPMVFINGRHLPRWRLDEECIVEHVVEMVESMP